MADKAWRMDYSMLCDPDSWKQKTIANWQVDDGMVAMMTQFTRLFESVMTIGISLAVTVQFFAARAKGGGEACRQFGSPVIPAPVYARCFCCPALTGCGRLSTQELEYELTQDTEPYLNETNELMLGCFAEYRRGKDIRTFGLQKRLLAHFQKRAAG